MEYSFSSWNEDTFVLEFSDDEYDRMDETDKYGGNEQTRRVSKRHDNSLVLHDYNAKLQLENHSDFKDLRLRQIQESENSTLPKYSPEKPQTTSTNIMKDEMVNVPKLIYQLLNAKVVIEKMYESSGKDLMSEKKCVLPNKLRFKDFVHRYCPKCKTLENDKNGVTMAKCCPRCETALKYACFKCNKKYLHYEYLRRHWKKCGLTAAQHKKFNPSDFLVKKTNIDYSREIIRYCSRCNKIEENCHKCKEEVCRNCSYHLLYQCNKCKAKYNTYRCLIYHLQSQCYPSQYKCNQCDFTNSTWTGMRIHVNNVHFSTKIYCPRCDRLFRKQCMRRHLKYCGSEAKFNCNSCAFKTKYKYNLRIHMKTVHEK